MLKRYFFNHKKRNFSIASIWIQGGSNMDSINKKGINKIFVHYLQEDVKALITTLYPNILSPMEQN